MRKVGLNVFVRAERPSDIEMIHTINREAFGVDTEAKLVEALRDSGAPLISLVAEDDGEVVGHILFSPVAISGINNIRIAGLAPMAVAPKSQKCGIGGLLIKAGLKACIKEGYEAVVVLGHSDYYPKFGFVRSDTYDITCEYEVPPEAFMLKELKEGVFEGISGTVKYHPAFSDSDH